MRHKIISLSAVSFLYLYKNLTCISIHYLGPQYTSGLKKTTIL